MVAGWNANRQTSNLFHIRTAFKKQLQQINGKQTFGNQIRTTFHRDTAATLQYLHPQRKKAKVFTKPSSSGWSSLVIVNHPNQKANHFQSSSKMWSQTIGYELGIDVLSSLENGKFLTNEHLQLWQHMTLVNLRQSFFSEIIFCFHMKPIRTNQHLLPPKKLTWNPHMEVDGRCFSLEKRGDF